MSVGPAIIVLVACQRANCRAAVDSVRRTVVKGDGRQIHRSVGRRFRCLALRNKCREGDVR